MTPEPIKGANFIMQPSPFDALKRLAAQKHQGLIYEATRSLAPLPGEASPAEWHKPLVASS